MPCSPFNFLSIFWAKIPLLRSRLHCFAGAHVLDAHDISYPFVNTSEHAFDVALSSLYRILRPRSKHSQQLLRYPQALLYCFSVLDMIVDNKAIPADPPAYSGPTPIVSQPPPIPQPVAGPSNTPVASPPYGYPPNQTVTSQRSNANAWPAGSPPTEISDAQLGTMFQNQLYARCARGEHSVVSKHGALGIICAVIMFPFGFICYFLDVEKKCERCGTIISRRDPKKYTA